MKKLLFALLIMSACADEETKDPMTGKWSFEIEGASGSFTVKDSTGDNYSMDDIRVNNDQWSGFKFEEVEKRHSVKIIGIDNQESVIANLRGIAFIGCHLSEDKRTIHVDSVYYRVGHSSGYTDHVFYNEVLTRD
jgi:hypothetical protein